MKKLIVILLAIPALALGAAAMSSGGTGSRSRPRSSAGNRLRLPQELAPMLAERDSQPRSTRRASSERSGTATGSSSRSTSPTWAITS